MKNTPRRHRPSITLLALLGALACLGLAACGGSSPIGSSSATTTTASSSTAAAASAKNDSALARPAGSRRFAALRECLRKNGITLRARPHGPGAGVSGPTGPTGTPGGHRFGFGGRGRFLQGLSSGERAKYQAAFQKCGGSLGAFRGRGGFARRDPAAFTKFVACMRENGVSLPKPNTSGKGPVFSTKGLDVASAAFKNAWSECRSDLGSPAGGPPGDGYPGGGAPPPTG